jgi:hypothetical protein
VEVWPCSTVYGNSDCREDGLQMALSSQPWTQLQGVRLHLPSQNDPCSYSTGLMLSFKGWLTGNPKRVWDLRQGVIQGPCDLTSWPGFCWV